MMRAAEKHDEKRRSHRQRSRVYITGLGRQIRGATCNQVDGPAPPAPASESQALDASWGCACSSLHPASQRLHGRAHESPFPDSCGDGSCSTVYVGCVIGCGLHAADRMVSSEDHAEGPCRDPAKSSSTHSRR